MYNFVRKYACTVLHINNLLVNMHSRYYTFSTITVNMHGCCLVQQCRWIRMEATLYNYIDEYAWMLPCKIVLVNLRGCYPVQFYWWICVDATLYNFTGEYAWMLPCTILLVNMHGCYPVQFYWWICVDATLYNFTGEYAWMLPCTILLVNMHGCYPAQFYWWICMDVTLHNFTGEYAWMLPSYEWVCECLWKQPCLTLFVNKHRGTVWSNYHRFIRRFINLVSVRLMFRALHVFAVLLHLAFCRICVVSELLFR